MTTKTIARAKAAAPAAKLTASPKAKAKPTITAAMRVTAATAPQFIKGAARVSAAMRLATDAIGESKARDVLVADVRLTFGLKPGQALPETRSPALADAITFARQELAVGRAAARLPASAFPSRAVADDMAQRIEFVRDCRCFMGAPVEEGKTAGALGKGKVGRMAPAIYQALRTADAWVTLVLADAGITGAQGQKAKNDKQADKAREEASRAPHHNAKADAPKLEAAKPESDADVTAHVLVQCRTLEAYCKKNAAHCTATTAAAITAAIRILEQESKLLERKAK